MSEILSGKCTCQKCLRTLKDTQFYSYKDGRKFELCKQCATMHIDNFNSDTFIWLLQKLDFPYIPEEWNVLRDKAYAKDPLKMNGMSVFGKYISKMRMIQWNKYTWADTERIAQETREKKQKAEKAAAERAAIMQQNFKDGLITEAEYKTLVAMEQPEEPPKPANIDVIQGPQNQNPFVSQNFISEDLLPDPTADLTEEDKIYLAMKWGRTYQPAQLLALEQKYTEMTNSFDIQDSDTTGTLILLCKTYLKMNEAIDMGDMDGFQKLSRVYQSLRKSAKFTAAQNKEVKNDYVDCVGELVAMCEKQGGFIERHPIDIPQDKVDKTLQDMNNYVYQLVTKDLGLGQRIEDQLKKMRIQQEMNSDAIIFDGYEQERDVLSDEDHEEFYDLITSGLEADERQLNGE